MQPQDPEPEVDLRCRCGLHVRMDGTYDPEVDAAYIRLVSTLEPGESKRQAVVQADGLTASIVFDLDDEDRILGIEILGARDQLRSETIDALRKLS